MTDGAINETAIEAHRRRHFTAFNQHLLGRIDQKMMKLGIRIVRYADDILIFAKSHREARKYQEIAVKILTDDLKLQVNEEKTHLTNVHDGVAYLGFIIYSKWTVINPKRIKKFKAKLKEMTPRNHGMNVEEMVRKLNPVLRGWANYFRAGTRTIQELMQWIRRRIE